MKKFYLIFLPIFFLFFSCATLDIGEFYEPFISTENIPASCRLGKQKPKILASNDIDNDVLAFRADKYYRIMGCSIFEANKYEDDEISEAIEEFCEDVDIPVGIYSRIYSTTEKTTSYSYYYSQYGSFSTPRTVRNDRYNYIIYLLAPYSKNEISNWHLGLSVRNLNPDERKEIKRNTGAFVTTVFNDFPAFYADIAYGDIIIAVNNVQIKDSQDFKNAEKNLKNGDNFSITYLRFGEKHTVDLISK